MELELDKEVDHDDSQKQHAQDKEDLEAVLALFHRWRFRKLWNILLLFRIWEGSGF